MTDETKPNPADQHPDYPGLTYGDVEREKKKALAKVEDDRKSAALKRVQAEEVRRLQSEEGYTVGGTSEEMVRMTLNLAPQMKEIVLDGKVYPNRTELLVRRSVGRELLYIEYKGWEHESVRQGEDRYAFAMKQSMAQRAPITIGRGGAISGHIPQGTH